MNVLISLGDGCFPRRPPARVFAGAKCIGFGVRCALLVGLTAPCSLWARPWIHGLVSADQPLYSFDFDVDDGGFVTDDPQFVWQYGIPAAAAEGEESSALWATMLDADYVQDCYSKLLSPALDLAAYPDLSLELVHSYDTDAGTPDNCLSDLDADPMNDSRCGDGGIVKLLSPDGEETIEPFNGYQVLVSDGGVPSWAFGGQSGGTVVDWFDLLGLTRDGLQLELLFVSNDTYNAAGWSIRSVRLYEGDVIPPRGDLEQLEDSTDAAGPYSVSAEVIDNRMVDTAVLEYIVGDGAGESEMERTGSESDIWLGEIPGLDDPAQISEAGVEILYRVRAIDVFGNIGYIPDDGYKSFHIQLPPPTSFAFDPELPRQAVEARVVWTAPEGGGFPIIGYRIAHTLIAPDGSEFISREIVADLDGDSSDTAALLTLSGEPYTDRFEVCALFSLGDDVGSVCGQYSEPLDAFVAVPALVDVSPEGGFAGDAVELDVYGSNTSFVQGEVDVDFAGALSIETIDVVDVTHLIVRGVLDESLSPQSLPVDVSWPGFDLRLENAFRIRDPAEEPKLLSVSPASVLQGEEATLVFEAQGTDFESDPPTMDFPPGIQLLELSVRDALTFEARIDVATWAPIGEGVVRIISGTESFEKTILIESIPETATSCSIERGSSSAKPPAWLLVVGILPLAGGRLGRRRLGRKERRRGV